MGVRLKRIRWAIRIIGRAELIFGGALLVFMTALITVQVILRSVFNKPLSWMEEAVTYALVWLTFIGASFGVKQLRHVTIVTFVSKLDSPHQDLFRILADIITLWLLGTLAFYAYQIIPIEGSATSVALPIDLPRSLFFSVALFVTAILMSITMLYYLVIDILILLKVSGIEERRAYPLGRK